MNSTAIRILLRSAVVGLLLLSSLVRADEPRGFELRGKWEQSALILGTAPVGTRVWFNGRALSLSADGAFVLGLDRDAPEQAELRVQLPGDKQPQTYQYVVVKRDYDIQRIEGLPPKMVTPPADVTERIKREQQQLSAVRKRDTDIDGFEQPFAWPCIGRVSGIFGSQRILNGVPKQPHYGVDVAVPIGTEVHAPADGVVALAEPDLYFTGGTLIIDHGHGLQSIMVHLSKIDVRVGQSVKQGEPVALSGMTGRATGPHLHWGVYWFDSRIDAQKLVPAMPVAAP